MPRIGRPAGDDHLRSMFLRKAFEFVETEDRIERVDLRTGERRTILMDAAEPTVSADGKTRTVTTNGTDPEGKKFTNISVYDRQ